MHSREAQQILVDWARQYSPHRQVAEKPGVRKLSEIKLMQEDPEGVEKTSEQVKARYAQIFKV
jgi:iron(III) transport system substrate-binding protein